MKYADGLLRYANRCTTYDHGPPPKTECIFRLWIVPTSLSSIKPDRLRCGGRNHLGLYWLFVRLTYGGGREEDRWCRSGVCV